MINQRITLLATAALWVLLAATWVPGVRTEPCSNMKVTGDYGKRVPLHEICAARYRTPNCRNFVETFNINDLPQAVPKSNLNPFKPHDLVVTGTNFLYNRVMYPGMHVAWSNPIAGVSVLNLLGFLLVWQATGSAQKFCQIFLLNTTTPWINQNLRYEFDIPKVEDNVPIVVKVYSLPLPPLQGTEDPDRYLRATFFAPIARYVTDYGIEPAKWSPYISVRTFKDGIIEIRYDHPPTYMQLFFYQIALIKEDDPAHPLYDFQYAIPVNLNRVHEGKQQFKVSSTGCYLIIIWVIERPESRMVPGECGCWALDHEGKKKCENICGSSQVQVCIWIKPDYTRPVENVAGGVTVVPKAPEQENQEINEVVQPTQVSTFTMVASILGIIMIVVVVVLMGLVVVFSFLKKH